MHYADAAGYLYGIADNAQAEIGAALRVSVKRLLDAEDMDGLVLMAMQACIARLEAGLDKVLAGPD